LGAGEVMDMDKFIGLNGMNYEMLYSQDVIERMKDYNEADYCSDDCLAFIDKYGEADFLQYYDDYLDFDDLYGRILDLDELVSYFSGFHFLHTVFYGAYESPQDFAIKHYGLEELPQFLWIDWDISIDNLKDDYEIVFHDHNQKFLVFGKE
jgi:hypothetical protein